MRRIVALGVAILAQLYYICKTYLSKEKKRRMISLIATLQVLTPQQIAKKLSTHQSQDLF
jgi:hypothetical protein